MRVNLNQYVKVKLSARGEEVLAEEKRKMAELMAPVNLGEFAYPEPDADGYQQWQLWELMRVFGPHMGNGLPIVFEDNWIDFGEGLPVNVYIVKSAAIVHRVYFNLARADAEVKRLRMTNWDARVQTLTTEDGA